MEEHLASISGSALHCCGLQGVEREEFHNRVPEVPAQLRLGVCKEFFICLAQPLPLLKHSLSPLKAKARQPSPRSTQHSGRERRDAQIRAFSIRTEI